MKTYVKHSLPLSMLFKRRHWRFSTQRRDFSHDFCVPICVIALHCRPRKAIIKLQSYTNVVQKFLKFHRPSMPPNRPAVLLKTIIFFKMLISGLFSFLDCHQVWQSHDPTSVQNFDFCGKKVIIPPFSFCVSFVYKLNPAQPGSTRLNILWVKWEKKNQNANQLFRSRFQWCK